MTLKPRKREYSLEIDVVMTVYNSSEVLSDLAQKLKLLAEKVKKRYKLSTNLIFVDDCSSDGTVDLLCKNLKEHKTFKKVTLIELSRNFGQHNAILAGLQEAKAPYVLLMDGDIDQDPLFSLELIDRMFQDPLKYEVVYAYRVRRGGRKSSQILSNLFWRTLQNSKKNGLEVGQMTMRIMKRKYVVELLRYQGEKVFWGAVFQLTGFSQVGIKYDSPNQTKSNYNLRKRLRIATDALLNYSDYPYKLVSLSLLLPSIMVLIYVLIMLQKSDILQKASPGWLTIVILLTYQMFTQTAFSLFLIQYLRMNRRGLSIDPAFHIRNRTLVR